MSAPTRTSPPAPPSAARRSFGVRLLVLLPLMSVVLIAVQGIAQAVGDDPVVAPLVGLTSAAGALAVYRVVVARLERRPVDEVRRPAVGGIASGLGIGLVLMSATIGIIALFGGYEVTGSGSLGAALAAVGTMAAVAATEELLFRGVVFRLAEEKVGTWGGVILSAVLFAALHLVNPDADLWGALALSVEAGAMLAAAFVATRSLWLPIGIHLAWNWAEGSLFGTVVSGSSSDANDSLLTSSSHGSALVTGAGFGPEASIPAILVCLVPTVLLMRLAGKRGRVIPRRKPVA